MLMDFHNRLSAVKLRFERGSEDPGKREIQAMNLNKYVTAAVAARIRGVSRARITAMVRAGKLKPYPIGEQYLLLRAEVENYEPQRAGRPPKTLKKKRRASKEMAMRLKLQAV